ncbi:acetyl-CoA C-acyltransferase [Pandoraea sputorum]|uniref:Beta-ketothiolase BktB n=1 Tax=Pandoraea sputorum TaxID=93222 RepID=A0A239S7Z5_9BURK|nr:acetyl-CoA C-acyltransferase [Pandoraea sputorum]AJC15548.1 acetyl-CoA acetyltransferase [Pandoraea sputorum]SNU80924.1 Beta-ketothiolase BktB [Pandoraea sputorum]VVD73567.1 acetyl-CoA acetyltransferase [Pandoraea sputorum]
MNTDIVIVDAVRTAIGEFGGALREHPPADLGSAVVRALLARTGVSGDTIDQVIFGNVHQTSAGDMYLARRVALGGGVAPRAGALTVNRLCGSGLESVLLAAQFIDSGEAETAIGGGAETMSLAPYMLPAHRFGSRPGDVVAVDTLMGGLTDPMIGVHMGELGERVAASRDIGRAEQDAIALASHQRAAHAIEAGYFDAQVVPLDIGTARKPATFSRDERVRATPCADDFVHLKPVFRRDGGTITAANASGISDGACAVLLTSTRNAQTRRLRPLARLVAHARVGVPPEEMGFGPVVATREVLKRADLHIGQIGVIEVNEAFASVVGAFLKELSLDASRVNPNGGAIALGHPVGATGAILVTKAAYELQRTGARYALVTTCIGGGQGMAVILERV